MKPPFFLLLIPAIAIAGDLQLEKEELNRVGLRVWQNECRGTLDGLITWNPNESFPSLGIGHFIWYPKGVEHTFEETFPSLIAFLKKREVEVPAFLTSKQGFPWKTRQAFLKDKRSKKVNQLRALLSDTLDLQILFIYERFKEAESQLLPRLTGSEKKHLEELKKTPRGVFALIDYVNFKGTGLSPKERYRGEGWGLLQVLQSLPKETSEDTVISHFIDSAKKVLNRRVRNAPKDRSEEQWLNGWNKRLESYSKYTGST